MNKLFEWIIAIDTKMLLGVNGNHNDFFDAFFTFFTSKETWYPFYILLLVILFYRYKMKGLWVVLALVLSIVLSDQISVFIKEIVARFRPSHEPNLSGLLNLPIGERGLYGFVSSHAANSFALAVFVGLCSKTKRMWLALFSWAILTGFSRVYLGVHYPFDILAGAILGALLGWGMYFLLILFDQQFLRKKIYQSEPWQSTYTNPLLLALLFITVTLLVVAQLMVK